MDREKQNMAWINSIFIRLIFAFFLIIALVYAVGIAVSCWGIGTVRKEIYDSIRVQESHFMDGLEKDIRRVRGLQLELCEDTDLNRLAAIPDFLSDIDRMEAVLNVRDRMDMICVNSSFIENMRAHIPAMNRTLYAHNGTIDYLEKEEYGALLELNAVISGGIVFWGDRLFLIAVYPMPQYFGDSDPLFLLDIELDTGEIALALEQLNIPEECGIRLKGRRGDEVRTVVEIGECGEEDVIRSEEVSEYLNLSLEVFLPESVLQQRLWPYMILLWTGLALLLVLSVAYCVIAYRATRQPLVKLIRAFQTVERGRLDIEITRDRNDEFRAVYDSFNAMVRQLNTLIDQAYRQTILMQKAQLRQLQSQINPHFLYNSFFILQRRIKVEDYENAMRFCQQLGAYFQFITRSAADEVFLEKETEHARIYAEIQAMRFSNRIKVEFGQLPEAYAKRLVPRLILQPIIENAFEYSLENKAENGILIVRFLTEGEMLDIQVEDNGEELTDRKIEELRARLSENDGNMEVTGMVNIHRRLQLLYGAQCGVRIARGALGGLLVTMRLKMEEEKDDATADRG